MLEKGTELPHQLRYKLRVYLEDLKTQREKKNLVHRGET